MPFKEHSRRVWEDKRLAGFCERKGGIKGIVSHRLVRLEFVAESGKIERRDWRRCRKEEVGERDRDRDQSHRAPRSCGAGV